MRIYKPLKIGGVIALVLGVGFLGRAISRYRQKFKTAYNQTNEDLESSKRLPFYISIDGKDVDISDCAKAEGMNGSAQMTAYSRFVQENMFGPGAVKHRDNDSEGNQWYRVSTTGQSGQDEVITIEIPIRRSNFLPKGIQLSLPDLNNNGIVGVHDDYKGRSARQIMDNDRSLQAAMRNQPVRR